MWLITHHVIDKVIAFISPLYAVLSVLQRWLGKMKRNEKEMQKHLFFFRKVGDNELSNDVFFTKVQRKIKCKHKTNKKHEGRGLRVYMKESERKFASFFSDHQDYLSMLFGGCNIYETLDI